jgi:hypothetical protein
MIAPGLLPSTPGPVDRTRPIFPYPEQAKYTGKDSIDAEANFAPAVGPQFPADRLQWLGSSFYTPSYETWCTVRAKGVQCSSQKNGK